MRLSNKTGSITNKLILTILLVVAVSMLLLGGAFYLFVTKLERQKAIAARKDIFSTIESKTKDKLDLMGTNAVSLASNPRIIEAFEKNDYTIAEIYLKGLIKDFEAFDLRGTRFHLTRADMTTFYRSYSPKRDDDISFRTLIKRAVQDKKPYTGMEIGHGGLYLRALAPVFSKNQNLLGIVELQMGVGSMSRDLKAQKVYYILLVDRNVVKEEEYKKSASDVVIGDRYLTAHNKWFDEETVGFARKVNYSQLQGSGLILNKEIFAAFQEAKDFEGKQYGIHLFGMKRQDFDEGFSGIYNTFYMTFGFIALLVTLLVVTTFITTKTLLITPISRFSEFVNSIKMDLTQRFKYNRKDEIGQIVDVYNGFLDNFQKIIKEGIRPMTLDIESGATRSLQRLQEAKKFIQDQTSKAEQVSTAAEEMSQTINDIARNTSMAADRSTEAMESAVKGKDITLESVNTIEKVKDVTDRLSALVETLTQRSSEIGEIVTVIKDIADQTNLLALNAAIEAARAGEQGRGFAVVADEVRKLAEKTIKATADISDKITAIQADANNTHESMRDASKEVSRATDYIKELEKALMAIYESVQQVKDQITHISASLDEQSATSEEVVKNIADSTALSREVERKAEEIAQEFNSFKKASEDLTKIVEGFKV